MENRSVLGLAEHPRSDRVRHTGMYASTRCLILKAQKVFAEERTFIIWGCSSAGRAPALQAGGHRFEPVHLHQRFETADKTRTERSESRELYTRGTGESLGSERGPDEGQLAVFCRKHGLIAQVVRAHA